MIRQNIFRIASLGGAAFGVLVLIFLILPTLIIVPLSFSGESFLSFPPESYSLQWYSAFLGNHDFRMSLLSSVIIGVPAASLATIFGTMTAVGLSRSGRSIRQLVGTVVLAPLIMPQIILALGLFPVMAYIGIVGTYPATILAHAVIGMPLAFITVSASLRTYPESLEIAAFTLGANPWRTFRYVTYPLIRPGIIVGFVFAFALSFDELILAMFLTSPATRTVPRMLWEQLNYQMTPIIAAATCVILLGTISLLSLGALADRNAKARPGKGTVA